MNSTHDPKSIRVDLQLIADMITPGTRVLDVGCGNGALLDYLWQFKQVDGRGIEISYDGVNACVSSGLSVIQGDVETDIRDYPDDAFDYVVLSQTLQAMMDPKLVLEHLLRVGKKAIVSFPNFAYWRLRWYLLSKGQMPISNTLAYEWYDTPNIHFCTIRDFVKLCHTLDIHIEKSLTLNGKGHVLPVGSNVPLANWFGEQAVFMLRK